MATTYDYIQLRRDTAAEWTAHNPVLLSGEIGVESDASPQRIKIGDGVTAWNSLPYVPPVVILALAVGFSIAGGTTSKTLTVPLDATVSGTNTGDNAANSSSIAASIMSAVGDLLYGGAAGAATRLAPNTTTTRKFLSQTGTGTAGQAPTWVVPDLVEDATPQLGGDLDLNGKQITNHRGDHWTKVPTANYTAAPASTSTITMGVDMTASILVGDTLEYVYGGTTYYGQVAAITANLLTVRGAPLDTGVPLTSLKYGGGTVTQFSVAVNGLYEDANDSTLLASDNKQSVPWEKKKSYCVYFKAKSIVHDSHATHGAVTPMVNGQALSTANTNTGVLIAANDTWYESTIDINTSNYDVNPGELLDWKATKGGNGDATDLSGILIIITP